MKKVNLGCGWDAAEGWINIDKSPKAFLARYSWSRSLTTKLLILLSNIGLYSKNSVLEIPAVPGFKMCDVAKGLPFKNNEVSYIYASHLLEHLTPAKASFLLKDCHRVLVPDGIVRILVPDLKLLVEQYLKDKRSSDSLSADRFMESLLLNNIGNPQPLLNRISGRYTTGHQWIYDFESLAHKLKEIGFEEIKECSAGKGDIPDIQLFKGEVTHADSLFLEAKK